MSDVAALKPILVSRLDELVRSLFPDKLVTQSGDCWRVGNHGSLSVNNEGVFFDHESGVGGDLIDLIRHTLRCDFFTAFQWCRNFTGSGTTEPHPAKVKKPAAARESERKERALQLWHEGIPTQGTLAEIYLRNRGITIPLPVSLRFLAHAWNYTTDALHPALLAAVQNESGKISAVQAIFLTEDGHKISGNKEVQAKLSYGAVKGGAVRLAVLREPLTLCEGIEDGMTILQSLPEACIWACLGTSNLMNIKVPDSITDIIIAGDNDTAGLTAARKLAMRLIQEGKRARIALPSHGKDFNAQLREWGKKHG